MRLGDVEILREQVLSSKAVDMLVGWAISFHLKHNVRAALPAPASARHVCILMQRVRFFFFTST